MESYERVNCSIVDIISKIEAYANEDQLSEITRIGKDFQRKINDFYREGRKLNIGVIGRVKAGKSSFLNTLLFNGAEILPKAATPKTATLTKMEYAEENKVLIEFYSKEEWNDLTEYAKLGDKNEVTKSARELIEMARNRGIDVNRILSEGQLDRVFSDYAELVTFLNDYVGENGQYTPLVRSVSIFMNREEFKEISIVDTPGLNDPVPSRTQRTKEFIEVCDVVFFLSRSSSFLDGNDWELLSKQLPQKGVKKIVMVASQYDSGLRDVLRKQEKVNFLGKKKFDRNNNKSKADNLPDAIKIVENSIGESIKDVLMKYEDGNSYDKTEMIRKILRECQKPVLLSSRAEDMARKDLSNYNEEELNDYTFWKQFIAENEMKDTLLKIGNFKEVKKIYLSIKDEKSKILEEKQREFIPKVYMELKEKITTFKKQSELMLDYLQTKDKNDLDRKRGSFESKMNAIRADIAEVFGDTLEQIKLKKLDINKSLREMSLEAATLQTRTGTETHHRTSTSYKFKLGFIKFGRTTSRYSYDTTYTYLAASDALEQINIYGKKSAGEIEEVFREIVEMKAYRRKLSNTIIRNFDASEDDFDENYFRIVIQNALNQITIPEVAIDVGQELNEIGNRFSGEVRNSSEQEEFRRLLASTVENLYCSIVKKVDSTVSDFQREMLEIEKMVGDGILEKVSEEFAYIKTALDKKEEEIEKYSKYIMILENVLMTI